MTSFADARERFWHGSIDFTETKTFLLGPLQAGIATIEFALMFVVVADTCLVPPSAVNTRSSSVVVAVSLDLVPGFVLSTGLPLLVQYSEYVNRLNDNKALRAVGLVATSGAYFCLLFYHPVISVLYAVAYLLGRIAVLVGIFGGSQLKSAIVRDNSDSSSSRHAHRRKFRGVT